MEGDSLQFTPNEKSSVKKKKKFNFDEFIFKNRWPLTFALVGLFLVGVGVFYLQNETSSKPKVEVLKSSTTAVVSDSPVVVEVSGAVEAPGVYSLQSDDRVEDALIAAGGVSADADRVWMEKFLNRAGKVSDGQKIYIPREEEKATTGSVDSENAQVLGTGGVGGEGLININTASQKELESLWGIGPVYAQNIIEQRPYSSVEELLTKKVLRKDIYERNKDKLTVY